MTNSARELLETIQGWTAGAAVTAEKQRSLATEDGRHDHVNVMLQLHSVREFLHTLDRVGRHTASYWPMWHSLVRFIAVYPDSWTKPGSGAVRQSDLATLDRLAQEMDDLGYSLNEDLGIRLSAMDHWLAEVIELSDSDDGLPEPMRGSIRRLAERLRAALRGERNLDAAQFVEIFHALWRELGIAEEEETDHQGRWARTRAHGSAFMGNVAANLAANGMAQGILGIASSVN